ncbi:DegT/DnrJ/EryC1/StrS family aminotransferase [Alkalimarinus alittae]|uniref:DegT/DnrJ/EryC1/StrS family aminotransferase n=1 Tax=Alkalimarinus alittae TaxID=2961619 RepID=A0ABY6MZ81_9ALTE|nr:DegT/DnrJ/EryC1/StrS family aminotransferase [Alkalimarinus alittae]UZE95151.1 DegT/DnrJ/EryC1/StrS family aminotransferase [Alkalimarinus alittae]
MQFIDLKYQQSLVRETINQNIKKVLDHGQYILGPEVNELEQSLAAFVGSKHCIGVGSGTDALQIALMAIGVKPGDEVIVPAFSFIATAEVVSLLGAKPVFVDVEESSYCMDSTCLDAAVTAKTKAIIPVSLYGQCANMEEINAFALKNSLVVIEDAAQSLGAKYKGKQSCNLSTIGCTSFFPSKPLGAYGDGGACFTNDKDIAKAITQIRVHGQGKRYHHAQIGINGRLDTLQAAILLAKLDLFEDEIIKRSHIANNYTEVLKDVSGINPPLLNNNATHVFAQYTIRLSDRNALSTHLEKQGIPTAIHYPIPLHKQPAFEGLSDSNLPISCRLAEEVLSLPMHPYLTKADQDKVLDSIIEWAEQ